MILPYPFFGISYYILLDDGCITQSYEPIHQFFYS
jgi:hypothetical protein